MGLYPVTVALQYDTTHKITHHTQTKHSTQKYKSSKGHILHTINTLQYKDNYNTNTITNTISREK
jgi:hypothetical protein